MTFEKEVEALRTFSAAAVLAIAHKNGVPEWIKEKLAGC
jgi:hypothetical protein